MKPIVRKRTWISGMLAVALSGTMLAACSSKDAAAKPDAVSSTDKPQAAANYPINTKETLKAWIRINGNLPQVNIQNVNDTAFGKELEKRSGVRVQYIHPALGQEKEQFNLLIASNDLPDTIEYDWSGNGTSTYPGGPQKALKDKVILPLNDLIDKYAPNLKKTLQEDKELDKMIKTDSGQYYVFPMVRNSSALTVYGPIIRKDWLDDLGLQIPTTIDEWHDVLKAFKEKKGAAAPFTGKYLSGQKWDIQDAFIGAYKTSNGFYLDDQGKVRYGPMDPQFKDALTLLHSWYAEGLIDKDFAVPDDAGTVINNKMTTGVSGSSVGATGGAMGIWLDLVRGKDPKYNLVAAPYPTLKKGEKPFIGQRYFKYNPSASTAVTTAAKNPAFAVEWLDYAFSPEGKMLFNFGIEGDSYTMVNGVPKFTDKILKNEKFTLQQILSQYTKQNGPFPTDDRRNTNVYKQQDEASAIWSNTEAAKHTLPLFLTPTEEESKETAKIMTAVNSYKEEMFVKFIMGKEPLDNFDKFTQQLKTLGIEKVLKIDQDANDRYQKR